MSRKGISDSTVAWLKEHGIPVTRENYLRLQFLGNPPDEPLDGEIEAELPRFLQLDICRRRWREELRTAMKNKFGKRVTHV
jgi:hypothetical protein